MHIFKSRSRTGARIAAAVLGSALVASCASGGRRGEAGLDPNDAFMRATAFQAAGDCARAVPIYIRLAYRGLGYQEARYRLGQCLIAEAGGGHGLTDYLEGMVWQRRAAEAGWAEAQGALVIAYLEGPEALQDKGEAALWLALYLANRGRHQIGFHALPKDRLAALEARLTPRQKADGEARAKDWHIAEWTPPRLGSGGGRPAAGKESDRSRRRPGDGRGRDRDHDGDHDIANDRVR